MDAALPVLIENMRQTIRGLGIMGLWIGGWRSASEFVSPRLWNRFVFPYFKAMVDAAVEEGAIPVLHFDANWTRDLELPQGVPQRQVRPVAGRQDRHLQGQGDPGRPHVHHGRRAAGAARPGDPRRGDRLLQAPHRTRSARRASSSPRAATRPSTRSTRTSRRWWRRSPSRIGPVDGPAERGRSAAPSRAPAPPPAPSGPGGSPRSSADMRGSNTRSTPASAATSACGPEPHGQSGQRGGAERRRLPDARPHHRDAGEVGLQLQQEVVAHGAAVHPQRVDGHAGRAAHGLQHRRRLEADGLLGRPGDVLPGGAPGEPDEQSPGRSGPSRGRRAR